MTSASSINKAELANAFRALRCGKCNEPIESQAKFCGQCGNVMAMPQRARGPYEEPKPVRCTNEMPLFARAQFADMTPKVKAEINSIMSALFRERFLLILNTIVLLGVNLFGFSLSLKAYTEFNGDEMTKLIIAFTPFLFVNGVGFVAMIPIRGTKREIYRLQQRLQFLRAQMEYTHLTRQS
ncbi:MAG TPA: zinc ribbon domain-containing protein [Candidatus Melainabacteria bacterium]|nr:zinc ribbon domain-containing protein [Candidatus Melainabacteria bacterium]HIN67099.1 zinc ribbon domain-containing protein [Candidatus Obscuribacterales bacterium]